MCTNPAIIDASFIRACPADGAWFDHLVRRGHDLVLSDHLAFELCSGGHPEQWAAAQRKIAPFRDRVHAWHATGQMVRIESETRRAFPHPGFEDSTARLRHLLETNPGFLPADINDRAEEEGRIRDILGPQATFRSIMALRPMAEPLFRQIRGATPEIATPFCESFVQNDDNVRALFDMADDLPAGSDVDASWVTWHVLRAHLALCCEYMRQANEDIFALGEPRSVVGSIALTTVTT